MSNGHSLAFFIQYLSQFWFFTKPMVVYWYINVSRKEISPECDMFLCGKILRLADSSPFASKYLWHDVIPIFLINLSYSSISLTYDWFLWCCTTWVWANICQPILTFLIWNPPTDGLIGWQLLFFQDLIGNDFRLNKFRFLICLESFQELLICPCYLSTQLMNFQDLRPFEVSLRWTTSNEELNSDAPEFLVLKLSSSR